MSELIVRCSSIGRLMAKPEAADLDQSLVDDEVRAIIAKTRRTDGEKDILDAVRRQSLSAGAKTHVRSLVREDVFGYEPADLNTRPILKGRQVEAACIDMLARLTGRPLTKNAERRTNGLITGECDVFDAPIRHGRDVKAPHSMESMPIVLADAYDSDYQWQMQGYMILWDAEAWSVDYLLVDTPDDLIGYEPRDLHIVSHLPEHMRWTSWPVIRDRSLQTLIEDKVRAARRYYREVLNEYDRTHQPTSDAPPWVPSPAPAPACASAPAPSPKPAATPLAMADLDF